MLHFRKLGCLPDPPDPRDHKYKLELDKYASIPETFDNAHLVIDVLSQGNLGSCVANSAAQALRMSMVRQGQPDPSLPSRLMIYYMARAYENTELIDTGTHLRTAFLAINKYGFCREKDYQYGYDISKFSQPIPLRTWPLAYDQKSASILRYERIETTGDDRILQAKAAISQGYAVCFGCDVDMRFCSEPPPESPLAPPTGDLAGGHAMLWQGYDSQKFTTLNSWGASWGFNGRCYFSYDYVKAARDLWVVELAPRYSK